MSDPNNRESVGAPEQQIRTHFFRIDSSIGGYSITEFHQYIEANSQVRIVIFSKDGLVGLAPQPSSENDNSSRPEWGIPTHTLLDGEEPASIVNKLTQRGVTNLHTIRTSPWAKYLASTNTTLTMTLAEADALDITRDLGKAEHVQFLTEAEYRVLVDNGSLDVSTQFAVEFARWQRSNPDSAREPSLWTTTGKQLRALASLVRPKYNSVITRLLPGDPNTPADRFPLVRQNDGRVLAKKSPTAGVVGIVRNTDGSIKDLLLILEPSHRDGFEEFVNLASGGVKGALRSDGSVEPITEETYQKTALHELREETGYPGDELTLASLVPPCSRYKTRLVAQFASYAVDINGYKGKIGGDETLLETTTPLLLPYPAVEKYFTYLVGRGVFEDEATALTILRLIQHEQATIKQIASRRVGSSILDVILHRRLNTSSDVSPLKGKS